MIRGLYLKPLIDLLPRDSLAYENRASLFGCGPYTGMKGHGRSLCDPAPGYCVLRYCSSQVCISCCVPSLGPILYYTILYYTILYYTILYYTILYYTILYYTILYYTILYYTILYYTILYYTILYYTILYYTILYYTILYYTILLYYTICYMLYSMYYSLYIIYYIHYMLYYNVLCHITAPNRIFWSAGGRRHRHPWRRTRRPPWPPFKRRQAKGRRRVRYYVEHSVEYIYIYIFHISKILHIIHLSYIIDYILHSK